MAAEIIHDHDVAFPEDGRELLLDPCAKAQTIDEPVNTSIYWVLEIRFRFVRLFSDLVWGK